MRVSPWLTVAIVTFTARSALAQESSEEQARQSFQRGVAALQQGRYTTAIAELEFSYGLLPRCSTQFNLAVAFEQTHRYADSLDTLVRYQAACADTMPAQNATYVVDGLRRLRTHVGMLTLRATPASAVSAVSVDHRARVSWGADIALDAGSHAIEVRSRDGQTVRRDVQVTEGGHEVLDIALGSTQAPITPTALASDPYGAADAVPESHGGTGRLRIESPVARATVLVDGHDQGEVPVEPRVTTGRHQIEVHADGYRTARFLMTVNDGSVTRLAPRLDRDTEEAHEAQPFYTRWWFWTIIGVAAVGGAVALTYELTRPTDNVVYTFQAVRLP